MGMVVAIVLFMIIAILVWIVNDASRLRKRNKIKLQNYRLIFCIETQGRKTKREIT